jgi:hypothetical protein
MILHGEQSLELLRPLPAEGSFTMRSKVLGVWDKGAYCARGGGRVQACRLSRGEPWVQAKVC